MVTKHGMILASFIKKKLLPFSNTTSDFSIRIAPHQSCSPLGAKPVKNARETGSKKVNIDCVCVKKRSKYTESFDETISQISKEGSSLMWLDPTQIPTECLATIFSKWLRNTKPTDNLGLGLIVPSSDNAIPHKDNFGAWTPTSSSHLKRKFTEIKLPVWFPSLTRKPEFLEQVASTIMPFDVFPIVEFPQIISYAAEKEIALHYHVLDHHRTRTRNFVYLNNESPEEAMKTLYESFRVIPRNGKMPRSLVITPGGKPLSCLITLLAGVLAGGTFITPQMESPYSSGQDVWGFGIFKKCE